MKIGDRVVGLGQRSGLILDGEKGTIVAIGNLDDFLVDFDKRFSKKLHDGLNCIENGKKSKNGWWCFSENLKLVEKDVKKCKSVYKLIKAERKRQNKLHPNFAKSEPERIAILLEEVGEVAKAYNDGDVENYKTELIQVAAVCVRMIEEG